jgi:arylsulfatase A-like enzyme
MPASTPPGRTTLIRTAFAGGLLLAAAGCSPAERQEAGPGLIHLAERLAPVGADPAEPPLPPARHLWVFPDASAEWTGPQPVVAAGGAITVTSRTGRALLASREIAVPLSSIHSIELRLSSTAGARVHLVWDGPGGELERRFARSGWDPGADPDYRVRGASVGGTSAPRDYRILARDLWREDPAASATTVARLYLAALADGPVTLSVERIGIVRREDLVPGSPRALVRETLRGIGMHAVRLSGGTESSAAVRLPSHARLRFSLATSGDGPGAIEVLVRRGGEETPLVRREAQSTSEEWEPVEVELSSLAGRDVELVFRTEGDADLRWFVGAPVVVGPWSGRNLMAYVIDTLRADVLEPYGYPGRTSPELSRLAREGLLFEECVSVSSWTRPAAASLLTSRSAPAHGVIRESSSLSVDVATWAELLRARGYYTVAFFTNPNAGRSSNLDRGFDLIFETAHLVEFSNRNGGIEWQGAPSGTSEGIFRRFEAWIGEMGNVPLFLYLHPNDPHPPWEPRAPFDAIPGMKSPTGRRVVAFARYARAVRVADRYLGCVLAALEERGILDRTVVAVASDHGEEFLDHGRLGHGDAMWTESLRVPLILRAPWALSAGRIHRGRVSLLDVMPTLADLAGAGVPDGLEGRSLVADLAHGETQFSPAPVFAHLITIRLRLDEDVMDRRTFPGDITVLQDRWKLMLRDYGSNQVDGGGLFDLRADPAELDDVTALHADRAEAMAEIGRAWYEAALVDRPSVPREVEIRPETMDQLRALGYVE